MPDFIYGLLDTDGNIRYIGKTNNLENRLRKHISKAKYGETKSHAANWIRSLLSKGKKPSILLLEEVPPGENWVDYEIAAIARYKALGYDLTNATGGGEGLREQSPELIAKRVASAGITKAKPENRARYSKTLKEVFSCPERRLAISERNKARFSDPVLLAKISQEFVGSERQSKMLAAMTPEVRKKQGRTFGEKYKDPDFRAKMSAALVEVNSRPEVLESKRKKMSAVWRDPEYMELQKWYRVAKAMALSVKLSDPAEQARRAKVKADRAALDALKARERRAKRKAEKAAILAATHAAPYTESS